MKTLARRTIAAILLLVTLAAVGVLALMIPVNILNVWSVTLVNNHDMSPTIPEGALVISEKVPTKEIKEGDIVTLNSTGQAAISTVSRVITTTQNDSEYFFQIQGDNNDLPDTWSYRADNSSYRLLTSIPVIGYLGLAINNVVGAILFILGMTALVWAYVLIFFKAPPRKPVVEEEIVEEDGIEDIRAIFEENGVVVTPWQKVTRKEKRLAKNPENSAVNEDKEEEVAV